MSESIAIERLANILPQDDMDAKAGMTWEERVMLGQPATALQLAHAALAVEVNYFQLRMQIEHLGIVGEERIDRWMPTLVAYVTSGTPVLVGGLIARPDLIAYQIRNTFFAGKEN